MPLIRHLADLGYDLFAEQLEQRDPVDAGRFHRHRPDPARRQPIGQPVQVVRAGPERPHVTGDRRPLRDGFLIRRTATERRIPCFTSLDTLRAALDGLGPRLQRVKTVPEYRAGDAVSRRTAPGLTKHPAGLSNGQKRSFSAPAVTLTSGQCRLRAGHRASNRARAAAWLPDRRPHPRHLEEQRQQEQPWPAFTRRCNIL